MPLNLSLNQANILGFAEGELRTNRPFNLLIQAVAGSGKTTTLMEIMRRTPSRMAILFLAFGKDIAEEIKVKVQRMIEEVGRDADVRTLNGMGYNIWKQSHPKAFLSEHKTDEIILEHIVNAKGAAEIDHEAVRRLVALAKHAGLVPSFCKGALQGLTPDTPEEWQSIIDKFEVDSDSGVPMQRNIMAARRVLCIGTTWRNYLNVLDFDDMMYMPMAHRIMPRFRFDLVLVDEAQDLSKVQRYIAKVICKDRGSRVFVGDRGQAIYGFRGADSESMDNILIDFACREMPLDVSFRCPRLVVSLAQQLVPHIRANDNAPEGLVATLESFEGRMFTPGDMVVCRNMAPLVQLAYGLIGHRVPVTVLGSELGKGLVRLVNQLVKTSKAATIQELRLALDAWEEKESADAEANDQPRRAANIRDKAQCIRTITENMVGGAKRVVSVIEKLFTDDGQGKVTLMTIHKSKGLESVNVWVLDEHLMPSPWATQPWQKQQESNLRYVAYTRSQSCLRFIRTGGLVAPQPLKEVA